MQIKRKIKPYYLFAQIILRKALSQKIPLMEQQKQAIRSFLEPFIIQNNGSRTQNIYQTGQVLFFMRNSSFYHPNTFKYLITSLKKQSYHKNKRSELKSVLDEKNESKIGENSENNMINGYISDITNQLIPESITLEQFIDALRNPVINICEAGEVKQTFDFLRGRNSKILVEDLTQIPQQRKKLVKIMNGENVDWQEYQSVFVRDVIAGQLMRINQEHLIRKRPQKMGNESSESSQLRQYSKMMRKNTQNHSEGRQQDNQHSKAFKKQNNVSPIRPQSEFKKAQNLNSSGIPSLGNTFILQSQRHQNVNHNRFGDAIKISTGDRMQRKDQL